ncbi:MAG: DUF3617 family protein [Allosphingosinicella sp.]
MGKATIGTLAILGALGLAACGGPGSEGGNAAASDVRLEPGEWEVATEPVNEKDGPQGVDAAMAGKGAEEDIGKAIIAGMSSVERMCITPEKAAGLFAGDPGEGCRREGEGWRNGRISTKVTCTQADAPQTSVQVVSGRYSARSFDITQRLTETSDGETTTMATRDTGRRIGDCPAEKKN